MWVVFDKEQNGNWMGWGETIWIKQEIHMSNQITGFTHTIEIGYSFLFGVVLCWRCSIISAAPVAVAYVFCSWQVSHLTGLSFSDCLPVSFLRVGFAALPLGPGDVVLINSPRCTLIKLPVNGHAPSFPPGARQDGSIRKQLGIYGTAVIAEAAAPPFTEGKTSACYII